MKTRSRLAAFGLVSAALLCSTGCTTTSALLTLAGASTDTSVTWSVVKYFHGQLTEGDPTACVLLNSVQRALSPRCAPFVPGSIVAADIEHTGLAECTLALAVRDPRLWPALPELLAKGARPEVCAVAPLVQLAQREPCPDFGAAPPATLAALTRLAETDRRSVHHDVMRMLSCPNAQGAGLDRVLADWRVRGALSPGRIGFSPLGALDPAYLATSSFTRDLEADGHTARAALGGYEGMLRPGFEEALRTSQWAALDWWLQRAPELANRVPPTQGNQLPWLPLARVLLPNFLAHPESRSDMVEFLLARGADPRQRLPSNENQTVIAYARVLKSPQLPMLEGSAPRLARTAPIASVAAAAPAERLAVAPGLSAQAAE
jgi:hypothetical protein